MQASASAAAVSCRDVGRRYRQRWVLYGLQLALPRGAGLLLTGGNGAGKTTLLRLLATVLRPSTGQVRLHLPGAGAGLAAARARVALVTHQHYLYEALSAAENLQLVRQLRQVSAAPDDAFLLAQVGLDGHDRRPVGSFSAGMKRRLGLARLLLQAPALALLDEPFAQLDADGVAGMEAALGALAATGATLIIATHEPARARPFCQWHLHLTAGAPAPAAVSLAPAS